MSVEQKSVEQGFQDRLDRDYKFSQISSVIDLIPIRIKRIQECYDFITFLMNKPITTRLAKINEEKMIQNLVDEAMNYAKELELHFKEINEHV